MAMVVSSTISLGAGSRANNLPAESLSYIDMFIAFGFWDQIVRADLFGVGDQMSILSENALSLRAS